VNECIGARADHGLALAPNQTATKAAWLLSTYVGDAAAVTQRAQDVCIGTVDSWIVWTLTSGRHHVTDHSNAAVTGLCQFTDVATPNWHDYACESLGIPIATLPRIVSSSGIIAQADALPGAPLIAAIAGDQQASLIGQSCVRPNMTKCTFGTGAMMNVCLGPEPPERSERSPHGTFPIVTWSRDIATGSTVTPVSDITWGAEAIMLSAGTNIEWLRDDLGLIDTAEDSEAVAAQCATSDGVVFVPALLGLGTPHWDYGARATTLGLTRGSTRSHLVRAVLEGVAHRGADLLEALRSDHPAVDPTEIRIDGGMSRNRTFVQAFATATGRPVAVSPVTEATTLGAAYLAGLATRVWSGMDDIERLWSPTATIEPEPNVDRDQIRSLWRKAVTRAAGWIPELSALDF
jgi:glycerol kinase